MGKSRKKSKFTVIWQEVYLRTVKSGAFILGVILPILLGGVMLGIGQFLTATTQESQKNPISVVSTIPNVVEAIKASNPQFNYVDAVSEEEAAQKLSEDDIAFYLVVNRNNGLYSGTIYRKSTSENVATNGAFSQTLTTLQLQEQAMASGVSKEVLQQVFSLPTVSVNTTILNSDELKSGAIVVQDESGLKERVRQGAAFVVIFALYFFLLMFSSMAGQEIASEKGTRVMEVVLSSTTATKHLLGKLFGISLAIFTQVAIYGVFLLIAFFGFGLQEQLLSLFNGLDILAIIGDMVVAMIAVILIATILYITLSALCGSMVSKVEDVQKVMTPLMMVVIIGFYIGSFAMQMPNHGLVRIGTFIPFISPFIIPFRLATNTIAPVELWSAILFMLIVTIGIVYLSVKFYRANVLIYSDKGIWQTMKQAVVLIRSEKTKK